MNSGKHIFQRIQVKKMGIDNPLLPLTMGKKIKYYRTLRGLTQKQLGILCGFEPPSADVRISQYEKNVKAPRPNAILQLSKALRVDRSALSDITINDEADIMRMLFYLDRIVGINVEISGSRCHLDFDLSDRNFELLLSYINDWIKQKEKRSENYFSCNVYEEEYVQWEATFPQNKKSNNELDKSISQSDVGERIAILRKNAGEEQNELADYLGISRGSLANYETGKRKPDINTIIRIARRYNTSTDYILGLSDIFDYE